MTNPAEKAHAEYSASGSHRWLNCPGSHALSKKAPPQRESPYAAEGTKAHACLEFMLKNQRSNSTALRKLALKSGYTEEMIKHAEDVVAWVRAKHAKMKGAELLCETKVDSSPFTCTGQFGTLDIALVQEFGTLAVIDFKYGAGVAVDPSGHDGRGNSQLVYYGLALSHTYNHNFTRVELWVLQPRAYADGGETYRCHSMTIDELLAWGAAFREGVMATNDPKAPLRAGAWCKFCPAATICPEISTNAMKRAQVAFSPATGAPPKVPDPKLLPIDKLPEILNACDALEDYIGKVREHAHHVLERGASVPGWKLVQKRSTRRWADEAKAAREAKALFGAKALSQPALLSPAQLEKLGAEAAQFVESRVTSHSSGTTLVRESHKGAAVESPFTALPAPITQGKA